MPKKYAFSGNYAKNYYLENIGHENTVDLKEFSNDLIVINFAAERRSKFEVEIKAGNYDYQSKILNKLLDEGKSILWIQIESYWQNSLEVTPSPRYVHWKNEFRLKLIELSKQKNLKIISIILPHVIGVSDDKNRYLNRIFRSITLGEKVVLKNGDNLFYICDIDDVCKYLINTISQPEENTTSVSSLFPFHAIKLNELVNQFKKISKSDSIIESQFDGTNKNPSMYLNSQPKLVSSEKIILTSLEISLANIYSWMKKEIL